MRKNSQKVNCDNNKKVGVELLLSPIFSTMVDLSW